MVLQLPNELNDTQLKSKAFILVQTRLLTLLKVNDYFYSLHGRFTSSLQGTLYLT